MNLEVYSFGRRLRVIGVIRADARRFDGTFKRQFICDILADKSRFAAGVQERLRFEGVLVRTKDDSYDGEKGRLVAGRDDCSTGERFRLRLLCDDFAVGSFWGFHCLAWFSRFAGGWMQSRDPVH